MPGLALPGRIVAALVLLACLGPVVVLLFEGGGRALQAADIAAIRFTLLQAVLSAALSCALAVPLARALFSARFPGRALLVTMIGAPFLLPSLVAVLGLLAIFGRGGVLNHGLAAVGLAPLSIYGLGGVVLAHVFLNLPLATRLILLGWQAVPAEQFRLAAALGLSPGRVIGGQVLRRTVPGAFLTVLLLCLTSFAVALTLGGGPAATTVELAIYQALRFEGDPGRAALLALVQLALGTAAALAVLRAGGIPATMRGSDRTGRRWERGHPLSPALRSVTIAAAAAFLLSPLAALGLAGLAGLDNLPVPVWMAALRSVLIALAATALALVAGLSAALAGGLATRLAGVLPLATSGLVLATGAFVLLRGVVPPSVAALPVLILVHALMALPFVLRPLVPAIAQEEGAHGRLASSLGLVGWRRLRIVLLPRLRPALGFGAGLSLALSMGDLGTAAIFGSERVETLPLLISRLMGAYRMEAASGAALVLVGLTLALFAAADLLGRRHARA